MTHHITESTPYSLALWIVCNCSEPRDMRFEELKKMLLARDYKPNIINENICKARAIPRSEALKDRFKEETTPRPVFIVLFDKRMPSVGNMVTKHWRTMVSSDPYLKEVFPAPPLVAYKVGRNLGTFLIRARIPRPIPNRPKRCLNGMHKCNKKSRGCPVC